MPGSEFRRSTSVASSAWVVLAGRSKSWVSMPDDVIGNHEIEFIVGKWIRNIAEIMNDVRRRARIIIQADRTHRFIRTTADIENLSHRNKLSQKDWNADRADLADQYK